MGYRDPMWPKETIPAWLVYILYAVFILLFIWLYPVIFNGNPNGPEPTGHEWIEQP